MEYVLILITLLLTSILLPNSYVETKTADGLYVPSIRTCLYEEGDLNRCMKYPLPLKEINENDRFQYYLSLSVNHNILAYDGVGIKTYRVAYVLLECENQNHASVTSITYSIPKRLDNICERNCSNLNPKKCFAYHCPVPTYSNRKVSQTVTTNTKQVVDLVQHCREIPGNCMLQIPTFKMSDTTTSEVQYECDITKHFTDDRVNLDQASGYNICQFASWVEVEYDCKTCEFFI